MWFEDDMQFRFVLKFGGGVAGPRSRQAAEEGQ
jgi:hypothetical protein